MSIQSDMNVDGEIADSDEQTLAKLLKLESIELHTTIEKPDPTIALDTYGQYLEEAICPDVAKLISDRQLWLRKNMTAYKGNRGNQIVEAIKAKTEEKNKRAGEALALGRATR